MFMKKLLLLLALGLTTLSMNAQDLRNSNNSQIGKIESDGTVRNSSNSTIGKVCSDGTVRNSSNSTIGYAKGVPVRYAALFFFFDFFKR